MDLQMMHLSLVQYPGPMAKMPQRPRASEARLMAQSTPTIGSGSIARRSDATERMTWLDTMGNAYLRQVDSCSSNTTTNPCQRGAAAQNGLADNVSFSGPVFWPNG